MKDNGTMPLSKVLTLFYNKIDYMYFLAIRICGISFVVFYQMQHILFQSHNISISNRVHGTH